MQKGRPRLKIVIAAGGTGGHLFPAQALAFDLMRSKSSAEVVFMSSGLSRNPYFQKDHFAYFDIASATPYKKNPLLMIKAVFHLIQGTLQGMHRLKKIRPKAVIGFGSFHSFPTLLAAKLCAIPIILFESNAFPGRVNRLCSGWSRFTAIHFQRAAKYLKGSTVCVRMPLLKKDQGICQKKAREYFKLDQDKLTFLVFGGSQGAQAINRFFCASLETLLSKNFCFQVVHIVGNPERANKLREIYAKYNIPASVKPFEEKMDFAWSAADLSISRAGAATLAEQIEFSIPSILIPYPYAVENHQVKNASFVAEEIKGGVKLPEQELNVDRLVSVIADLLRSQQRKLKTMKESLQNFKKAEYKKDFCSVIFNYIEKIE